MILLVDVGNTRIKWALSHDGILSEKNAIVHDNAFSAILDRSWMALATPEKVVIANSLQLSSAQQIEWWVQRRWACPVITLSTPETGHGVSNAYVQSQDLGIDRWLNILACHHLIDGAACVVDCGTAVTVDAIQADGQHLGGCILPGLKMMRSSLHQTGGISVTQHTVNNLSPMNASTNAAVYCGTLYALVKAIDAIVSDMRNELASDAQCIITGGDAEVIAPLLQVETVLDENCLFKGMIVSVN